MGSCTGRGSPAQKQLAVGPSRAQGFRLCMAGGRPPCCACPAQPPHGRRSCLHLRAPRCGGERSQLQSDALESERAPPSCPSRAARLAHMLGAGRWALDARARARRALRWHRANSALLRTRALRSPRASALRARRATARRSRRCRALGALAAPRARATRRARSASCFRHAPPHPTPRSRWPTPATSEQPSAGNRVTAVGFGSTQLALVELESTPLDHSGKLSLLRCLLDSTPSFAFLSRTAPTALLPTHRLRLAAKRLVCLVRSRSACAPPALVARARPLAARARGTSLAPNARRARSASSSLCALVAPRARALAACSLVCLYLCVSVYVSMSLSISLSRTLS